MSIQDLIQTINTQLPDNDQQLITEGVLRGVLGDMVDTLSSELRVFNIESGDVTYNGGGTYTLPVENELDGAIAIDELLNIYQYDGSVWTLKVDATMFATAVQGEKADSAVQPGDNVSILNNDAGYLTETTHDNLPQDNPHGVTASQVGLGNVDNTSDADKPVSTAQGLAINQAEANAKQYTDDEIANLNLGTASQSDVGDFATSAQGAKADTAVQPGDNVSDLTNDSGFVDAAGAAAAAPVQSVNSQTGSVVLDADDIDDTATNNKFVTAAEKSDIASAVQPGDLATVATTGAYSDLSGTPTLGTAAAADTGDFATSTQGSLADTSIQPDLQDISGADWVLDEDDMISDSDTKVPTQQSVKAYVDANIGGSPVNPSYGYQTLTDAANISWDMDLGEMAEVTLGGNRTLDNPTNLKKGTYSLLVKQDANGGRTLDYGTAFKWPGGVSPNLTSDPNAIDLLTFVSDGTNLYGAITSDYS